VEVANIIKSSAEDLREMINGLIDKSKGQNRPLTLELGDVPLADVKELVERGYKSVAEEQGLGFSVRMGEGLPASIYTDPKRLRQVLGDLLSNAFRFTRSGRVELHITQVDGKRMGFDSEALHKADRVIAFSVMDTGIGIPQDHQKLIFEAFPQLDGSSSRQYHGRGLGLPISLALSHLLGGDIRVESALGKGSTFTL
jgi:signal transduction histidine kinase